MGLYELEEDTCERCGAILDKADEKDEGLCDACLALLGRQLEQEMEANYRLSVWPG